MALHSARSPRNRARLLGVAAAVLGAEAVWLVAELALGMRVQAPAGTGSPEPVDIGPLNVALATIVLASLGWAALAALERLTPRARRIWLLAALVAAAASLSMPLSGTGLSFANRAALVLMHVAAATVLIPVLYRTSGPGRPARSQLPSAVAHGGTA